MGYTLMKALINNRKHTKERLTTMANVYYAAGQLNDEQYMEVMELINAMEA